MPRQKRPTAPTAPLFQMPPDEHSLEAETVAQLNRWHVSGARARAWILCARNIDTATRAGNASAVPKLLIEWRSLEELLTPPAAPTPTDTDDPVLAAIARITTGPLLN